MEDTLVSSRIARAKKEAGVSALHSIGATTSDLINSAFDYVIETHSLPSIEAGSRQGSLGSKQDLAAFLSASSLAIDWSAESRSYKDIMRERRAKDYESLA